MSAVEITSQGSGRYTLTGELTFVTVPDLWRQGLPNLGNRPVQLDLAGISRVDSAGIGLLIELIRAVHRQGNTVSLHHAPPQLRAIATVSGLNEVLPFV